MSLIQFNINRELSPEEMLQYKEIFSALIVSGGGTGVKNGRTILHFDAQGIFKGVELNYWPWKRRGLDKTE